ncbi:Desumoylating isopeptidase 1 [Eumeta japonica]|uniref:Desumoylating isopeptidase 1 n=1 Tax=Eumeta variegata TaxID=151549 RepID=A0A4C1XHN8_EUMVA|nr:Desumoylating isopeptidase 1 [Eumeta japonica]
MESKEGGEPVDLYIYDLTNGLASLLSPALLGQQIEGVWHTAVVVFGREYFYGSGGITSCNPSDGIYVQGGTQLGAPLRVVRLGVTGVCRAVLRDYLRALATGPYK